jgi:hypothetical protein
VAPRELRLIGAERARLHATRANEADLGSWAYPQHVADLSIRDALEVLTGGPLVQSFTAWARAIHPGIEFGPCGLKLPVDLTAEQWRALGTLFDRS